MTNLTYNSFNFNFKIDFDPLVTQAIRYMNLNCKRTQQDGFIETSLAEKHHFNIDGFVYIVDFNHNIYRDLSEKFIIHIYVMGDGKRISHLVITSVKQNEKWTMLDSEIAGRETPFDKVTQNTINFITRYFDGACQKITGYRKLPRL